MACTTAERAETPPGVRDELEALFAWNPPRLYPAAHTQQSTNTRSPSFYDKHFDEKMVVKKVERYPSLIQVLASIVDKALEASSKTLPTLESFVTAEDRAKNFQFTGLSVKKKRMANKASVTYFYFQTTAKLCLGVASTLALHPSSPIWSSLLEWTPSGHSPHYAIMDGQLCFIEEDDGQAPFLESMDGQTRAIYEEVRDSMTPLAIWEMKSLWTGSPEVMNAVLALDEFAWTFCSDKNCFIDDRKHQRAKEQVRPVVIGFDAKNPPWTIPVENRQKEIQLVPPVTRRVTRSAAASGSSTIPPAAARVSRSSGHRPTKGKGKKRKLDDDDTTAQSGSGSLSSSSEGDPSTKHKGKKRKQDNEAYQDRPDIIAHHLVQQAWAQAVHVDGTILVLHSGNQEIVCLRRRDTQTLYVSDVIEPPTCSNPGYAKIHVGIYIAAIQDIMDRRRQQQLSKSNPPTDGGNSMHGGKDQEDHEDQDHNRGSGSRKDSHGHRGARSREDHGNIFRGSAGGKGPTDGELVAIENAIHEANNRNIVLLYLRYDVYNSPVPASFFRSAPSILAHTKCPNPSFSPRASQSYRLKECLTIVLTSEIGRGATGVAHRGTLKPELLDGVMPLDVVVKLAFDDEQRDALRSEYKVYCRLKSKKINKGIATALGLFDDCEGCACALVQLYAGVPLSKAQGKLSTSDRKSALRTLRSIHDAGILHGDIRRANILVGDSGVTIIDFGHSEECDNQGAKDQEMARLRGCLRLECKH